MIQETPPFGHMLHAPPLITRPTLLRIVRVTVVCSLYWTIIRLLRSNSARCTEVDLELHQKLCCTARRRSQCTVLLWSHHSSFIIYQQPEYYYFTCHFLILPYLLGTILHIYSIELLFMRIPFTAVLFILYLLGTITNSLELFRRILYG